MKRRLENPAVFKKVEQELCNKLAEKFDLDIQQTVYEWFILL